MVQPPADEKPIFETLEAIEAKMAADTSGYIKHHLQNLTYGQMPNGDWGFAHTAEQAKEMGFLFITLTGGEIFIRSRLY